MNFQVLSKWMINHSGVIETGNDIVDSVFTVLLSTTILVGGVIGCLLDNIIPGTICTKIILSLVREFSIVSLYKTIKYFVCIYYYQFFKVPLRNVGSFLGQRKWNYIPKRTTKKTKSICSILLIFHSEWMLYEGEAFLNNIFLTFFNSSNDLSTCFIFLQMEMDTIRTIFTDI